MPPSVVPTSEVVVVEKRIRSIPIVKQALFFLSHAGTEKGIKITEKGFLGRNFVQSFWDEHLSTTTLYEVASVINREFGGTGTAIEAL
jgi:hypothetical protein